MSTAAIAKAVIAWSDWTLQSTSIARRCAILDRRCTELDGALELARRLRKRYLVRVLTAHRDELRQELEKLERRRQR